MPWRNAIGLVLRMGLSFNGYMDEYPELSANLLTYEGGITRAERINDFPCGFHGRNGIPVVCLGIVHVLYDRCYFGLLKFIQRLSAKCLFSNIRTFKAQTVIFHQKNDRNFVLLCSQFRQITTFLEVEFLGLAEKDFFDTAPDIFALVSAKTLLTPA